MDHEEQEEGAVGTNTYQYYVQAAGGYGMALAVVCLFLIAEGTKVFNYWWLAVWLGDGNGSAVSSGFF